MILGKIGELVNDEFSVIDNTSNLLVDGINVNEFTGHLFDPDDINVYDSTSVDIVELGYGHYRVKFTPNKVGNWLLVIYHPTYFPWGKSNTIQVFHNDFDSNNIMLQKILGLVQENYFMDNTIYDEDGNLTNARIRTYENSSLVGTDYGVLETYNISVTYDDGKLLTYKVKT